MRTEAPTRKLRTVSRDRKRSSTARQTTLARKARRAEKYATAPDPRRFAA